MKLEVISGAAIAAFISFLNALLALFMNDAELTFAMIKQAAWVGMVGGAVLQFFKDYQAGATRRFIANMRGKPDDTL